MNQNYGFSSGHGTQLITTQTANYGTQNPGPSSVSPFMGGQTRGEMMGTASDGSSIAAYTPIVHAMPLHMQVAKGNRFVPEGTIVALTHSGLTQQAAQNCQTADECVGYGLTPGCDSLTNDIKQAPERLLVTASGCNGSKSASSFKETVSFAWQSVTRVLTANFSEFKNMNKNGYYHAGEDVYVQISKHDDGRVKFTASNAIRFLLKPGDDEYEEKKACTYRLGTLTLPFRADKKNHNIEDQFYICLCATQKLPEGYYGLAEDYDSDAFSDSDPAELAAELSTAERVFTDDAQDVRDVLVNNFGD